MSVISPQPSESVLGGAATVATEPTRGNVVTIVERIVVENTAHTKGLQDKLPLQQLGELLSQDPNSSNLSQGLTVKIHLDQIEGSHQEWANHQLSPNDKRIAIQLIEQWAQKEGFRVTATAFDMDQVYFNRITFGFSLAPTV